MASLSDAPEEVLLKVFSLLDSRSLVKAGCSCRRLRALAGDDDLWHRLLKWEFGDEALLVAAERFSGQFGSCRAQAVCMHENPLFRHFEQKRRLLAVVETTRAWSIEIRKPGFRWHNDGKLLFSSEAVFSGYTGQCLALTCRLPSQHVGSGWAFIVGQPHAGCGQPFVLSCAHLNLLGSGSSPAQVWPNPWVHPRDGDLKVVIHNSNRASYRRQPEGDATCTIFVHVEQTSLSHFAASQELKRLKGPLEKPPREEARVIMDLFDQRGGGQLCSLIAVVRGHRVVPAMATATDAWFSWGLEKLKFQVGAYEDCQLVADVSIQEFGRWSPGRNRLRAGLFIEPLASVGCTIADRGDVVEVMMKVPTESGGGKFYCKLYLNYSRKGKKPFFLSVAKIAQPQRARLGLNFEDVAFRNWRSEGR